ncbi:RES family NAD+ phosphorylase [Burkholderia sp. BE17]|uniref:RES family NAD+ phosphorylase n=1 Tax=Burkholderia sp. BE17 TaxID=2656644 RepID=UPI00187B5A7E|nr:RES family NAD+ phosphorylase [Burkholderia sp. BE17]
MKGKIPSVAALTTALESTVVHQPVGTLYCRAAWGQEYLLPHALTKAHRFGPPRALRVPNGALPFGWLYLAHDMATAIWESQFAKSDAMAAGGFFLDPVAVERGVLGRFTLTRELALWDLSGEACSKLGIFDTISSRDHEACHWIGYNLRQAMLQCEAKRMPDGFLYPSRRMRGRLAMAIRSDLLDELRQGAVLESQPFKDSSEYALLQSDSLRADVPDPTVSFGE